MTNHPVGISLRRRRPLLRHVEHRFWPGQNACLVFVRIFPAMLDAYIVFFQRTVDSQFDHKRSRLKLFLACNFFGSLGEYMIKALFETFPFDSLPFPVILTA